MDVKTEIAELMCDESMIDCDNYDEELINRIRNRLENLKTELSDKYGILELWYRDGCCFPFETIINTGEEEKTIMFNGIQEMLDTIRLLR